MAEEHDLCRAVSAQVRADTVALPRRELHRLCVKPVDLQALRNVVSRIAEKAGD
jgi:hypothetical protein